MDEKDYRQYLNSALEYSQNAYAPYSKFKVGATIVFDNGNIYHGCNVENASYGLSLCAERNAISNAVANGEKGQLLAVAIASPNTTMCSPCGACRQWISEFSNDTPVKIILEDENKCPKVFTIQELLPESFTLHP